MSKFTFPPPRGKGRRELPDRFGPTSWKAGVLFNSIVMPGVLTLASWTSAVPPLVAFPLSAFGVLPFLMGLVLIISAVHRFRRAGVSANVYKPPPRLVMQFPFNRVRNPIYLSVLLAHLGIGLIFGAPLVFAWVLWMLCFFNFLAIPWEERKLNERFGDQYLEYKRRVPRWLPRFR